MLLRMARPMRREGSSFHQFRKRIPLDILDKARGTALALPIGNEVIHSTIGAQANEITASLRTRDPNEAKARQAIVLSYLESVWQSLRNSPTRLTHKQALGLAGEAYKSLVGSFEDDPGSASLWSSIVKLNASVLTKGEEAIEKWFGSTVDQLLATHHLQVDNDSRKAVLEHLSVAITQASVRVAQFASSDYSPDVIAEKYPAFEARQTLHPSPVPTAASNLTITGLTENWWREAKAAGRSISTYEAYARAARLLSAFLKHNDAHAVTDEDIIRFKDHRLDQGASIKTVTATDLPGIRQLFKWAVDNKKLQHNPAEGVKVAKVKKTRTRQKGFTDDEAKTVLEHAYNHTQGRESDAVFSSRRWVPWLCAYTGARVGEMIQLRKQDLRHENDLWIITITPEAGTVKDDEYREIPLHPHLVDLGFPDFVDKATNEYLFMTPANTSEKGIRGAWRSAKNRLTEFVREVITDPALQPNHAWRHRFMTVGRELQIPRDIRFAITGHSSKDEGDDYGDTSNKAKAIALAKYPRYEI